MSDPKIGVLFVCLGNICRSPLAEGVFQHHVREAGLEEQFRIDSAGTGSWHVGEPADRRMRQTAKGHGVLLTSRGRQFEYDDFQEWDHILVMDRSNLHDVLFLDRKDRFGDKVRLFREFDPEPEDHQVPDPYYGGPEGFERVYQIVDRTCAALLKSLRAHYDL
ncbi:MAG: low molecular weight phosphotyrosine protein phosphatase [Rhodothermales bacterium]|nr:low molecular weight phosphotyrosine protein phosphatase [Rhodothermales bacterium]MBO6779733.1 low molecular weight phosphotyrosine protein phosphatase [Rhodothermales bacterium]